ncbi:hypothetical protein OHS58_20205 [Amycolatopsis sp. NBC_00348]|uniref:hypothetical protein n=1 Tax=Amycolatopsis sp. NBC_00348 TaxID=2975956 RepID=UPI002E268AEA
MSEILVTTGYTRPRDEAAVASAGAGREVGFGRSAGASAAARGAGRLALRGFAVPIHRGRAAAL